MLHTSGLEPWRRCVASSQVSRITFYRGLSRTAPLTHLRVVNYTNVDVRTRQSNLCHCKVKIAHVIIHQSPDLSILVADSTLYTFPDHPHHKDPAQALFPIHQGHPLSSVLSSAVVLRSSCIDARPPFFRSTFQSFRCTDTPQE